MKPTSLNLRRDEISDLSKPDHVDRMLRQLTEFGDGATNVLSRGLTFTDNFSAFVKTLEIAIPNDADEETLTLTAPWIQASQPVRIMRHGLHRWFEGQATRNAAASGSTVVTLASGDRPIITHDWVCGSSGFTPHQVNINASTGVVTSSWSGAPATTHYFDGPVWEAVQHAQHQKPYPILFKNDLPAKRKAVGCWVVGGWDITTQSEFAVSLGSVAWQMSSTAEQIEIHDIHDMDPGRRYRVTLIVVSG